MAARSELPVPAPMSIKGDTKGNWKFFRSQYSNYEIATGLDGKDDNIRVATLLTIMGKDCYQIYESLPLSADDRKKVKNILDGLEAHFQPATNVIYERYVFNTSDQSPNESFDDYLCRLREMSKTCEFETFHNQMIRDRIVIGTKDTHARGRMLRDNKLTLENAIDVCRTSERTTTQLQKLQSSATTSETPQVNFTKSAKKTRKKFSSKTHGKAKEEVKPKPSAPVVVGKCKYCAGKHEKDRDKCPAFGQTCSKCKKKNHFSIACRLNKVHGILDDSDSSDSDSLYAVTSKHGKQWYVKVTMDAEGNTGEITCQLDSGSTCNVISYIDYARLVQSGDPPLQPATRPLKLYGGMSKLMPRGKTTINCTIPSTGLSETLDFYVVDMNQTAILSAEACELLKLLTVNVVSHVDVTRPEPLSQKQILTEYKDVFEGLGELPGEYHIELDPTVKPVQHLPRRVPQALKEDIRSKIDSLVKRGVLTKVTDPTEWISNMVAVKKPGKLRICIDPRDLNQAIKRSHYPMPTVDDILPKIAKAKVFTVLDAREGFWHVKLDHESSLLTTFWTPFGRYRWLRMPFGISSAPEEFQRCQHEVLEGLSGTEAIIDDILVYGCGDTTEEAIIDHDRKLRDLLERARSVGLKFNKDKLKLRQSEVKYMGQILTADGMRPDPEKVKAIVNMPRPTDVKAVQRFIGLATYLSKYLPHLSEACEPLRRLTDKDAVFAWQSQQENAFNAVKQLVSTEPVLRYYDVTEEVTIQCDASEVGLGATLLQKGQPVAFASRALSQTEQRYAQIEKECLAIVFACEHFDQYYLRT